MRNLVLKAVVIKRRLHTADHVDHADRADRHIGYGKLSTS